PERRGIGEAPSPNTVGCFDERDSGLGARDPSRCRNASRTGPNDSNIYLALDGCGGGWPAHVRCWGGGRGNKRAAAGHTHHGSCANARYHVSTECVSQMVTQIRACL